MEVDNFKVLIDEANKWRDPNYRNCPCAGKSIPGCVAAQNRFLIELLTKDAMVISNPLQLVNNSGATVILESRFQLAYSSVLDIVDNCKPGKKSCASGICSRVSDFAGQILEEHKKHVKSQPTG